ncbi:uncharacterized protein DFL_009761 [Arthrobotrys flagrans]|uniref:Uncharacterized protein n=1 Tax=Arthrobotrys flagrans TaxID=97331 RepID=A0A436ZSK2_ARTFL|nr:hypothetical protein DFL_009761 [Arthrobotrys flagrans]
MLFSRISVVIFAVLATKTLARNPGRYARRLLRNEIAQPTPAITPAPILPAAMLKARAESTSSNASDEEASSTDATSADKTETHSGSTNTGDYPASSSAHTTTAKPTSTHNLSPNLEDAIGMDFETTTVKYTHTSLRTTTMSTKYVYDITDMDFETTTVKNMSSARTTHTTSSGYMYTRSYTNDMDNMDDETTPTKITSAHTSTGTKTTSYWGNDDTLYTYTHSYDYEEDYPTTTTKLYTPGWAPASTEDDYIYVTSTSTHGYKGEPMYTTQSDGSLTMDAPNFSPTNTIDLKKFRSTFGGSDSASIDCKSMPEGMKQGVAVKDLINILKQPDGNVYHIDRSGCFQAKCIGDYGVLRLCNLKPRTGVMTFRATEVKAFLSFLLQAIRPNWESEISINFNKLVYQPDAITFCGSSYSTPQQQMSKPRSPFPQTAPKPAAGNTQNKNKPNGYATWPQVENMNMPLSFQPRFPNYWGDNLGIPVARDAKFNGIVSNAAMGWAIVIDSSNKEDLKCNNADNFKTACGTGNGKDPEACKWDNTVPKPYFVPGDEEPNKDKQ